MRKKIIGVLGLGIFGRNVAKELSKFDQDVIAIDINENLVQNVSAVSYTHLTLPTIYSV